MSSLFRLFLLLSAAVLLSSIVTSCKVDSGRGQIGNQISGPIDVLLPSNEVLYVSNANTTQEFFTNGSIGVLDVTNPLQAFVITSVATDLFNGRMAQNQAILPGRFFITNRKSVDNLDFSDHVFEYDNTDLKNPVLARTFDVGDDPYGIDIIPAGPHAGTVLVSHISIGVLRYFDATLTDPTINFLDLTSPVSDGTYSGAVAVSPDGALAVVSSITQNVIYLIDLTPPDDFTIEAVLQITNNGFFLSNFRDIVWIDNSHFAVTNRSLSGVVYFDLNIILNNGPIPDDTTLDIFHFDCQLNPGVRPVYFTPGADSLGMVQVGNELYVAQTFFNQVVRVDLTTLFPVGAPIPSGGIGPTGIRLSPDGQYLYVANQSSGSVGIISVTQNALVGHFP